MEVPIAILISLSTMENMAKDIYFRSVRPKVHKEGARVNHNSCIHKYIAKVLLKPQDEIHTYMKVLSKVIFMIEKKMTRDINKITNHSVRSEFRSVGKITAFL